MTFETDPSGVVEPLILLFTPLYRSFTYHFTNEDALTNVFLKPYEMLKWVAKAIDANVQVLSGRSVILIIYPIGIVEHSLARVCECASVFDKEGAQ